ncbi:hypothetical protein K402DRAFT_49996 [Aulographum hederae CBS 113979]|uniref:Uncharacterized protein n=1 Tax=Aulographum hederae CBS 113979 TaxID=1176131 RepID=A0A6G1H395_9PEZI|nr:hypothetical protein K402DRAFT_49996 [Aulographum hederae CBS 113979]
MQCLPLVRYSRAKPLSSPPFNLHIPRAPAFDLVTIRLPNYPTSGIVCLFVIYPYCICSVPSISSVSFFCYHLPLFDKAPLAYLPPPSSESCSRRLLIYGCDPGSPGTRR